MQAKMRTAVVHLLAETAPRELWLPASGHGLVVAGSFAAAGAAG